MRRVAGDRITASDVVLDVGSLIAPSSCDTAVGNTVEMAQASYTNTIGDPLLSAHWVDPDFDAAQRAFYYVRVLEIPMTVQDRAYTSPIWYTP